ncbi:MAG: transposase [Chloroflexota bacterium]|nr:transposase [Chloroflexota bacterium]
MTLQRPKLRGTTERFASQLFGTGVVRSNALEALVIAGFVRGLSVRDVEAALTEALGESATVSKSTVWRVCEQLKTDFEAWSRRRLDDITLDYLFLDGSHFKYHANAGPEPVLAAWGIDTDGKPVFIGIDAAAAESGDAWAGFLTDLGERGLACPLLVVSDGASGLIGAVERTMGAALRQRCLIHRACKESSCRRVRWAASGCEGVEESGGGGEPGGGGRGGVAVPGEDRGLQARVCIGDDQLGAGPRRRRGRGRWGRGRSLRRHDPQGRRGAAAAPGDLTGTAGACGLAGPRASPRACRALV